MHHIIVYIVSDYIYTMIIWRSAIPRATTSSTADVYRQR